MKKFIKIMLIICLFGLTNVYAVSVASPSVEFNVGDDTSFFTDGESFDYSLISFSSNVSGKTIAGPSDMKKIYSFESVIHPTPSEDGTYTDDSYSEMRQFTAYCLDGNKKYPDNNIVSATYSASGDNSSLVNKLVSTKIFELCSASETCTMFNGIDGVRTFSINNADFTYNDIKTNFVNDSNVTINVSLFVFTDKAHVQHNYTGDQLKEQLGITSGVSGKCPITIKRTDFTDNDYVVSAMPTELIYKKALWIIEHSYPSLELEKTLNFAGVNYNTLKSSLKSAYETKKSVTLTDAETNTLVENYVYGTIQYSIWKIIGSYYSYQDNQKLYLGDELIGNDELNKLYKFYIQDRDVFADYDKTVHNATLSVNIPEKESYRSTSDAEYYGPYTVKSNMLLTDWNTAYIGLPKSVLEGVTLVDKDLNELPTDASLVNHYASMAGNSNDEIGKIYKLNGVVDEKGDGKAEFYIKISSKAKTTTKIELAVYANGYSYSDQNERGRLFRPYSKLDQTVAVSANLVYVYASNLVTLEFNAKTGDTSIGMILLALSIAFGIGYITLKFSNPVKNLN